MRTYQIIVVSDLGTRTHTVPAYDMEDAIHRALGAERTRRSSTITAVTCTTL